MNSPELAMLGLSVGELVIVMVALGILSSTRFMRGLMQGIREFLDQAGFDAGRSLGANFGGPAAEALTVDNQTAEVHDLSVLQDTRPGRDLEHGRRTIRRVIWVLGWMFVVTVAVAILASVIAVLHGK
jgi:hypothetical protein